MRSSPYIERCDACDATATGRCRRCDRPWCQPHALADELCQPCANELERLTTGCIGGEPVDRIAHRITATDRRDTRRAVMLVAIPTVIVVAMLIVAGLSAGFLKPALLMIGLVSAPLALIGVVEGIAWSWRWRRRARLRRRFIAGRRDTRGVE